MSTPSRAAAAAVLDERADAIAKALVDLNFERIPALQERYGAAGRERCLADAAHHLSYLRQALLADQPSLFANYVEWGRSVLTERGIPTDDLRVNLECLQVVLASESADLAGLASPILDAGLAVLTEQPEEKTLIGDGELAPLAQSYLAALLARDRRKASRLVLEAVEQGTPVRDIYLQVFQPSQWEVGRLWQLNRISVAQEHFCTAATQLVMSQLYPYLFSGAPGSHRLVATTVSGDLHELGVRMVSDFFEMAGWDTCYLGANTPIDGVLDTLRDTRPHVLAVSATISAHLDAVRDLIAAVRAEPDFADLVIIVGGYPFNQAPELALQVGANGTATDADGAISMATDLLLARP